MTPPCIIASRGYCPYDEPRAHARAVQSAGNGRNRIHRIRHQPAAGLRRPAAAHGLRAARAPPFAGLHYFGVVQAILGERTRDWVDFYRHLFGFTVLPRGQYFGVLPKGTLLESPCHKFYLQLIEPPPGADDIQWDEGLVRLGLGAANVPLAVRALQERGIVFVDHGAVQPSDKGALTQFYLGGVTFEMVVSHL